MWAEIKSFLRPRLKAILGTPMERVFREIRRRGLRPETWSALEVFGGSGDSHTVDYASSVAALEVWEIRPTFAEPLRRNLPHADVKITDAYEEMNRTEGRFDLVVVDNPAATFGADKRRPGSIAAQGDDVDQHCEHFDLFPDVLGLLRKPAVLVLNVIPEAAPRARAGHPYVFSERHLAWRRSFYGTDLPENVSPEQIVATYERLLAEQGLTLEWHFFERRTSLVAPGGRGGYVHYLVLRIERADAARGLLVSE